MEDLVLRNGKTFFEIDFEKKEVTGGDLRDPWNEPRCYNQTSRSLKRAAAALKAAWTDETTMFNGFNILQENGVRMRSYCAVD